MKALMNKELKLVVRPENYIFLLFCLMLLIPSYPYYVAFIYTFLGVFFLFLYGRTNQDVFFTVSLPVSKRQCVKARCVTVACIELVQLIISIPFAIISARINPNPSGNMAGIEPNAAFFGLVFVMYGLFNIIFIPVFYKTAWRCGRAFLAAGLPVLVFMGVAEAAVAALPGVKAALDTTVFNVTQLVILIVGIILFALGTWAAYVMGAKRFDKVDV